MERVIAVVVTYNRQALLSECLNALKNQTRTPDAILVVNNGSTDNTVQFLQQQEGIFYINQDNVGSGGGFSAGINWAYRKGYAWIWCMDDDGYPREDALENLLKHDGHEHRLLNCAVLNKADKKSFVWKTGNYATIDEVKEDEIEGIGHPFNGTLLHRSIVAKVGVPKQSLFLWGDETEYYYRIIRMHGYRVCTIPSSIHYHPASAFSYKNDWDHRTGWKMYYYVRNRFHVHRAKFNNSLLAMLHYMAFLIAFAGVILVFQKTDKMKKLSFMIWPATDALRNNFSATPRVILTKLAPPSQPYPARFRNYIRGIAKLVTAPYSLRRARPANV